MDQPKKSSKAWQFIATSLLLLIVFGINSLLLAGQNDAQSTNSLSPNAILSFLLASGAVTLSVLANVSAFMNPTSSKVTRIISPILLVISFALVAPFFIAFGITLTT